MSSYKLDQEKKNLKEIANALEVLAMGSTDVPTQDILNFAKQIKAVLAILTDTQTKNTQMTKKNIVNHNYGSGSSVTWEGPDAEWLEWYADIQEAAGLRADAARFRLIASRLREQESGPTEELCEVCDGSGEVDDDLAHMAGGYPFKSCSRCGELQEVIDECHSDLDYALPSPSGLEAGLRERISCIVTERMARAFSPTSKGVQTNDDLHRERDNLLEELSNAEAEKKKAWKLVVELEDVMRTKGQYLIDAAGPFRVEK